MLQMNQPGRKLSKEKLKARCFNIYTVVAGAEVLPVPLYDEIAARTCLFPKAFPLSAFTTTEGQKGQTNASAAKQRPQQPWSRIRDDTTTQYDDYET